jgi:Spx/MgsR family transcriptional regulator
MNTTLYGIPNCDTIKKAKKWLDENAIEYTFHNFRKDGIERELVAQFCQQLGWEKLLNKRGTTYRQLSDEQKESINDTTIIDLLVEYSAMIKRPVLSTDGMLYVGFNAEQYKAIFKS